MEDELNFQKIHSVVHKPNKLDFKKLRLRLSNHRQALYPGIDSSKVFLSRNVLLLIFLTTQGSLNSFKLV